MATWATVLGLALNLAGVLLLFAYGMPSRLRSGGKRVRGTIPTPDSIKAERHDEFWGRVGLVLIILGTASQMVAALVPPSP
jgi:hypothetical protein